MASYNVMPNQHSDRRAALDIAAWRAGFPMARAQVDGQPLVYLDTASSGLKPAKMLDDMDRLYRAEFANVHRGLHRLSARMTERYESVRTTVARFLNAPSEAQIVFTSGATAGLNLISYAWALPNLTAGDEIILSTMEHHANIVPWHFLRERQGVRLTWVPFGEDGSIDPEAVAAAIGPRTKLVAVSQMSNVLGTMTPVHEICRIAREKGVPTLVDGAQAAVHAPVDVQAMGCDFYVITGHKLYGPTGSGAVWIAPERLAEMRPFFGGGDMIREVTLDAVRYAAPPLMFEAGTPAILPQIGMGIALDHLMTIGMDRIARAEAALTRYAMDRFTEVPGLTLYGNAAQRGPLFSFSLASKGASETALALDDLGIAVRAGSFCSQPLMRQLGVSALCRASFGIYTTFEEVDRLVAALTDMS